MVDSQVSQHPWAVARFYLNPDGTSFLGYHTGQKWNGFAVPFFPKDEAAKVVASVAASGAAYSGYYFNHKTDQFFLIPHDVPPYAGEPTNGETILVDGHPVHVYGIGAGGWTWNIGPALCESCDREYLTEDFQCPKCGVSHTAAACATCGRFGLHKDDCDEPPGHDTEGGPAYRTTEERVSERRELASTFERAFQYYNGWGFAFEHPGCFSYYQFGGDLTVLFTPDHDKVGVVPVAVNDSTGESVSFIGDFDFTTDRSAHALFRIVKPTLDALAGKSAADLKGGAKC
jgi:hypothetical protein